MTIKEVTCYQTSDGRIWTTRAQADFWENNIIKASKVESISAPEYNMRNEGYENHYYPSRRD